MDGVNLNGTNANRNSTELSVPIGLSAYQGPLDALVWLDAATASAYAPDLKAGFYFFMLNDQEDGYWLHAYNGSNLPFSIAETPANPSPNVTEEDDVPENVTLYPSESTPSEQTPSEPEAIK